MQNGTTINRLNTRQMYECPQCKAQIVTGFGEQMIDYQVSQDFLRKVVKKAIEGGYAVKILRKE